MQVKAWPCESTTLRMLQAGDGGRAHAPAGVGDVLRQPAVVRQPERGEEGAPAQEQRARQGGVTRARSQQTRPRLELRKCDVEEEPNQGHCALVRGGERLCACIRQASERGVLLRSNVCRMQAKPHKACHGCGGSMSRDALAAHRSAGTPLAPMLRIACLYGPHPAAALHVWGSLRSGPSIKR